MGSVKGNLCVRETGKWETASKRSKLVILEMILSYFIPIICIAEVVLILYYFSGIAFRIHSSFFLILKLKILF
jgi:hypothetical protein